MTETTFRPCMKRTRVPQLGDLKKHCKHSVKQFIMKDYINLIKDALHTTQITTIVSGLDALAPRLNHVVKNLGVT